MIVPKVTKKQSFTLSLENTFLEKQQVEVKLTPPHLALLRLKSLLGFCYIIKVNS